uniref:Uncharacterized protein n=1 Tax=Serinus canaria TaxID=9135 RepID=A0A8C9KRX2_SERCA
MCIHGMVSEVQETAKSCGKNDVFPVLVVVSLSFAFLPLQSPCKAPQLSSPSYTGDISSLKNQFFHLVKMELPVHFAAEPVSRWQSLRFLSHPSFVVLSAALDVELSDDSFPPEDFGIVSGMLSVKWDRIAPASNVSHTVVLRPLKA